MQKLNSEGFWAFILFYPLSYLGRGGSEAQEALERP